MLRPRSNINTHGQDRHEPPCQRQLAADEAENAAEDRERGDAAKVEEDVGAHDSRRSALARGRLVCLGKRNDDGADHRKAGTQRCDDADKERHAVGCSG